MVGRDRRAGDVCTSRRRRRSASARAHGLLPLAAAAVVAAACGSQSAPRHGSTDPATQPVEARYVPVELRFIANTLDGQHFHGQNLVGKPAVLWFWAPGCSACRSEAPVVDQVAAAHPAVTFVGVAGIGQARAIDGFTNGHDPQGFAQLTDADGGVSAKFGVTRDPAFAFVHPSGRIDVVDGPLTESDLARRAADLAEP
jgi:thiol-disulfide isomerase/thioredoxin